MISLLLFSVAGLDAAQTLSSPPGADFFGTTQVHQIRITLPAGAMAALRNNPRQDVAASVQMGTNRWSEVAVHLKGSTGSFRPVDDKPGLTLNFDRILPGRRFHGLSRIHLNNSVEDPGCLNEWLGSELFQAARLPAPRVTHAVVELNGRRLGLYVLKEGFTPEFLSRYFRDTTGNLYDTGRGHDIDELLEKDLGANPDDRSDLKALTAAAREPDLKKRWAQLQQTLDMDRFLSFMALEIMLGHRDGYCLARNNFRIYHDPEQNRMVFLPHGMDQLLGNPDASVQPMMNGLLARAVLETPEGRAQYRQRCESLLTNVFRTAIIQRQIAQRLGQLRPVLNDAESKVVTEAATSLQSRATTRRQSLVEQLAAPPLPVIRFHKGVASLSTLLWKPVDGPEGGGLERTTQNGRPVLVIHAGPVTAASWRGRAILPQGRYHFAALARTASVHPLPFGRNQGAALRVTGSARSRISLTGTQDWKALQVDLEVTAPEQEVEFICELRASRGEAWFDLGSLRLERIQPSEPPDITFDKP